MEKPVFSSDQIIAHFFDKLSKIQVLSDNNKERKSMLEEFVGRYMKSEKFFLKREDKEMLNFYLDILDYSVNDKRTLFNAFFSKEADNINVIQ